jgi:hypothetical protein
VNEFWREARLKLFSYAVAALSKKGSSGQNLSGRARAIFTLAVNLRGFPPGVPTGWGRTACVNTVVLARAVSATPPSIAIEALVLGGPERVRARCVEQQQLQRGRGGGGHQLADTPVCSFRVMGMRRVSSA